MSETTVPLSQPRVAVIRSAADRFFFFHAMDTFPGFKATVPSETERSGLAHLNKQFTMPNDDRFAFLYHGIVDAAMGHLVTLLAQAVAHYKDLEAKDAKWIQDKAEGFRKEKLLPDAIGLWFSLTISDVVNVSKTSGFNDRLRRVVTAINQLGLPYSAAEHKLSLAMAIMGSEEPRLHSLGAPVNLEHMLSKARFTQREAAIILGVTDRTIRNYIRKKLLTNIGSRIVKDDKFRELCQRYNVAFSY